MDFIQSLRNLLTFKSGAVVACQQALRRCEEHSASLQTELEKARLLLQNCQQQRATQENILAGYGLRITSLKNEIERLNALTLDDYYEEMREKVGEIPLQTSYWAIIIEELKALGIEWDGKSVPESEAYHPDEVTLARMLPYLSYPASYADPSKGIDCDDFAHWASADASKIFKVNSIMQVKGNTPYGYHAWSMARVEENEYRCWEPDLGLAESGRLFGIGEKGYLGERWQ